MFEVDGSARIERWRDYYNLRSIEDRIAGALAPAKLRGAMSPEEIVRAEMAAWGHNDVDEVMTYLAENLTLHSCPYPPVSGRDAIRKTVEGYFRGGACVGHEILYLATIGDVVLMERIDHWIINGRALDIPHMGVCEVKDQKITAWREYFTPPGEP